MKKKSGFKMKGSPMARNFGISPMKNDPPKGNKVYKQDITGEENDNWNEMKKDRKNFAKNASERYKTTITKKDGVFSDSSGKSVSDLERDYLTRIN